MSHVSERARGVAKTDRTAFDRAADEDGLRGRDGVAPVQRLRWKIDLDRRGAVADFRLELLGHTDLQLRRNAIALELLAVDGHDYSVIVEAFFQGDIQGCHRVRFTPRAACCREVVTDRRR